MSQTITIKVKDDSSRPMPGARVTLAFRNTPRVEEKTNDQGVASLWLPAEPDRGTLTVRGRWFQQRVIKELNRTEWERGAEIKLVRVNSWYLIERILEAPGDLIGVVPAVGDFARHVRALFGAVPRLLATARLRTRLVVNVLTLIMVWALLDHYLLPWSIAYHNWKDRVGIPSIRDSSTTCLADYPAGRVKYLGPGEVTIRSDVTINSKCELRIRPGTDLVFDENVGMRVDGVIDAEGTRKRPITFKCAKDMARWGNLSVNLGRVRLAHCHFEMGGGTPLKVSSDPARGIQRLKDRNPEDLRGGALLVYRSEACEIADCRFDNNQASFGGAIYMRESHGNIRRTVFQGNHSYADNRHRDSGGGAVCLWRSDVIFSDCTFKFNRAREANGCGGAVYVATGSVPEFANCTFTDNAALGRGGAIYANRTHVDQQDEPMKIYGTERGSSQFVGNKAGTGHQGGAIHVWGEAYVHISDSLFERNSANSGGACSIWLDEIASLDHQVRIVKNRFVDNQCEPGQEGTDIDLKAPALHVDALKGNRFEQGAGLHAKINLAVNGLTDEVVRAVVSANQGLQLDQVNRATVRITNVPYVPQMSPKTSLAAAALMVIQYRNPIRGMSPDQLRSQLSAGGDDRKTRDALSDIFRRVFPEEHYQWRSVNSAATARHEITRSIRGGDPLIISTHSDDGPNMVAVTGFNLGANSALFLWVHDPAGRLDFSQAPPTRVANMSGRSVEYRLANLANEFQYELGPSNSADGPILKTRRVYPNGSMGPWLRLTDKTEATRAMGQLGLKPGGPIRSVSRWDYFIRKRYLAN